MAEPCIALMLLRFSPFLLQHSAHGPCNNELQLQPKNEFKCSTDQKSLTRRRRMANFRERKEALRGMGEGEEEDRSKLPG